MKLKTLKFTTKSHNNKKNIIKNVNHIFKNSNSLFLKPSFNNNHYYLDINTKYNINGNLMHMNKESLYDYNNKKSSNNFSNNHMNSFLRKKISQNKNLSVNAKYNKGKNRSQTQTNFFPKYQKKIQNNNIIYNNNIYLANNINDSDKLEFRKFFTKNNSKRKFNKNKSFINFHTKRYKTEKEKKESTSSLFYTKINYSLTNNTFCYFREINHENNFKLNLLDNNMSIKILCEPPFNFIPGSISFNTTFSLLKITLQGNSPSEKSYSINEFENTIVSSLIKLAVEIYRKFNKIKGNENDKKEIIDFFLEKFVEEEKNNYPKISREKIKKCALNNYYNFSILLNNGKKIEFIMTSYKSFKEWINGLALIIKNKNHIISTLETNSKSSKNVFINK